MDLYMEVQGVPRNMTVVEKFKMSSSYVKLFHTKENNQDIIWQTSHITSDHYWL